VNDPTRRLFFALWPDEATRDALCDWQRLCVPKGARRTHRDDLHITLHFLGQVPDERLADLNALGAGQVADAFELRLDHLGCFARPQVLWAGPKSVPRELENLHEDLGEGLRELGFTPESRPYKPHLTLARKVRELPHGIEIKEIKWVVSEWGLICSRSGQRPLYEPLATWSLGEK
jgi:2'-5' RNA ligase